MNRSCLQLRQEFFGLIQGAMIKDEMIKSEIITRANGMLTSVGLKPGTADWLDQLVILAIILLLAWLLGMFCRYVVVGAVQRVVGHTKVTWDDELFNTSLLRKLFRFLPVILIYILLPLAFGHDKALLKTMQHVCSVVLVWVTMVFLSTLIKTIINLLGRSESMEGKPLKGVQQILQITVYLVGVLIIISILIQKDMTAIFAALGASAAVTMLIFKDSITGFVSGVQLSANNMLKPGDWITMPKYGADGTVIDVTLTTVKVRNFDNTITTIPPYALTNDSFQNWRGMEESPGRRIKRSINIDMNSVKFCTPEMLEKYRKVSLLTRYIDETEAELQKYNSERHIDGTVQINARRQTNIGVFRAYLDRYLASLPQVNQEMTCMVRQLQPTENGIPIELYFFSAVKEWIPYERVQADVFDHVLSVIPEFELYVFQNPSGRDMQNLIKTQAAAQAVAGEKS